MNQIDIDGRLIEAINRGDCVAFVGAGFSAAAGIPQWRELLRQLVDQMGDARQAPEVESVRALIADDKPVTSRELEMAAQLLYDAVGAERFSERLNVALQQEAIPEPMAKRRDHLLGIPFRAIVTTNFDLLLPGQPPSGRAFRSLLRNPRPSPWREAAIRIALRRESVNDAPAADDLPPKADTPVVQLHGNVGDPTSLVMTRSQYRRRLYADRAYLTVLRSLLATSRVLFLGYSLTDAYLNELRSELIEAFSDNPFGTAARAGAHPGFGDEPLAWAVLDNVSEVAAQYYRRHEGLGVIAYDSGPDRTDHSGFDAILKDLYDQTNPIHRLGSRLNNKRILWLDPHPDNNDVGRQLIRAAVEDCSSGREHFAHQLYEVTEFESALTRLASDGPSFDLVISHWGYDTVANSATAVNLLQRIAQLRAEGRAVGPVVIFASGGEHEAHNRSVALRFGAAAYETRWGALMVTIERLLPES